MAKKEKEAVKEEATPSKGRKIMLTDPSTGNEVARVDIIKEAWNNGEGMKRGDIRKMLKEKYDHEVAYQIVFAATKTPKAAVVDKSEEAAEAGKSTDTETEAAA